MPHTCVQGVHKYAGQDVALREASLSAQYNACLTYQAPVGLARSEYPPIGSYIASQSQELQAGLSSTAPSCTDQHIPLSS